MSPSSQARRLPDWRRDLSTRQQHVVEVLCATPGLGLDELAAATGMSRATALQETEHLRQEGLIEGLRQRKSQRWFPALNADDLQHWRLLVRNTRQRATTVHLWITHYGLAPRAVVVQAMNKLHGWTPKQTTLVLEGLLKQGLVTERVEDGQPLLAARTLPLNDEARLKAVQALEEFQQRQRQPPSRRPRQKRTTKTKPIPR